MPLIGVVASGNVPVAGSGLLNHAAIAAPRIIGNFNHTATPSTGTLAAGTLFTPTAGRFLLCVFEGAVTASTPASWTLPTNGDAVNNSGLYVWYRASAAGSDSITTTHNGSGYPCVFDFYEFSAGTTFVGVVRDTAASITGVNPNLTGLTGTTNIVMAAKAMTESSGGPVTLPSVSWNLSTTESLDYYVLSDGVTTGYVLSTCYRTGYSSASFQPTGTYTTSASGTCEALTWAVKP